MYVVENKPQISGLLTILKAPEKRELARRLWQLGYKAEEISPLVGVSVGTIKGWERNGLFKYPFWLDGRLGEQRERFEFVDGGRAKEHKAKAV